MDIRGKKLMILGGNPETAVLVEAANSMGLYTVVVDPNPNAPAKINAWKRYDVDGLDVPSLVAVAKKENVDGVLVGVADILIESYQRVCHILSLPCYATSDIVYSFTRKDRFKEICEKYGINGIPTFELDADMRSEDIARIEYPVMVKPVDNGGGVGMTICYDEGELRAGVKKALEGSVRKTFVVERYMNCDDIFVYFTFQDGEVYLSAIADRITTKEQGDLSPVCIAAVYPSKYIDDYFAKMHDKLCRMFKAVGVRNGVLMIQMFIEGGNFYAYDPGFRLQGEAPHLILNAVNGFDHRKMLINFALTGSMGEEELNVKNDCRLKGNYAGSLWFLLRQGKIEKVDGIEDVKNDPNVIFVLQRMVEGDVVTAAMVGNERQVLARVYFVCETKEQYREKVRDIQRRIKVADEYGNDMLIHGFDPRKAWAQ